jgi:hypothetical protein
MSSTLNQEEIIWISREVIANDVMSVLMYDWTERRRSCDQSVSSALIICIIVTIVIIVHTASLVSLCATKNIASSINNTPKKNDLLR